MCTLQDTCVVLVYPYLLLVQDSTQPDLVVVCYGESTDLVVDPTYHLRSTYPTEHRYGDIVLYPVPRSWYLYPYTVCCTGLLCCRAYVLPAYCVVSIPTPVPVSLSSCASTRPWS